MKSGFCRIIGMLDQRTVGTSSRVIKATTPIQMCKLFFVSLQFDRVESEISKNKQNLHTLKDISMVFSKLAWKFKWQ